MGDELSVWTDGTEWYVATSPEHANALWTDQVGDERDAGADPWVEVPADKTITIKADEEGESVSRTAAQWAESNGPGMLCTTEW